jgi:glycosyltransferase involved in cell wall biosynthesis
VASLSAETQFYFERFGFWGAQIAVEPPSALGLVVVIPCYNEPDLLRTLEALWACDPPSCDFEVIVVVNDGENSCAEVREQNQFAARQARDWAAQSARRGLHVIEAKALPRKKAGVGLARKIGMDEALRRLDAVGQWQRPIVCFDADCICDANYLVEIERFFRESAGAPGAAIYFEHPLEGREAAAITAYELHLRYYVEGLRRAGFPHAFHTVGSSMAVRAEVYRKQGGMNTRQAGEDFYFLHKIIPLGPFGEINGTRVIASARPSERVPFGTGRAVRNFFESGQLASYPVEAFSDLGELFQRVAALQESNELEGLPESLLEFLHRHDVTKRLNEIRTNSASPGAFRKRFFGWFDGFLAMKYIHFARDTRYGEHDVFEVARQLCGQDLRGADLLWHYRRLQRSGAFTLTPPCAVLP